MTAKQTSKNEVTAMLQTLPKTGEGALLTYSSEANVRWIPTEDPRKKIAAYTSMHVATKILANQV